MSLKNIPHHETETDTEFEEILDEFCKIYQKLNCVYNKKYDKNYDIRVVINSDNNITIIDHEENYTYCYRKD